MPQYDAASDGQRFLLVDTVRGGEEGPAAIHIVQNWYEEFRDREQEVP